MATTIKDYGLLAKKVGMTQVFDDEGNTVPVTAIQIAENVITDIKNQERDGYWAVQIGAYETKEKLMSKPERENLKKKNLPLFKKLKEFRCFESVEGLNIGDAVDTEDFFKDLEKVDVTGISIGKGFQGGVKLHNMHVGRRSHGSKSKRQIGSIGPGTTPGNVKPGKRMPSMMGNKQVTTTKIKVFKYDAEKRLLLVKGPVPGKPGNELIITTNGVKTWNHYNKESN